MSYTSRYLLVVLISFLFCNASFSSELSIEVKEILKKHFSNIALKIDNSFTVNNKDVYLPLMPRMPKQTNKIEITNIIQDETNKNLSKLIELSNGWIFVKLIKQKDGSSTIIDLKDIPDSIKNDFLNTKFPVDLVVPKGLVLKEELSGLAGNLPIKIERSKNPLAKLNLNGLLYLTSPDTGKIVYLDFMDASMIYKIQTKGAPWDLAYNDVNKTIYVSDFAKDSIYTLPLLGNLISSTITLPEMSSPTDIELSSDGSLIYILESLSNKFSVYKTAESKILLSTNLPSSPVSFSFVKEPPIIAVSCTSLDSIAFLNSSDFSPLTQIMLDKNPAKIISNPTNNFLYIANRNGDSVSILDPVVKKVKSIIEVGEAPIALVTDLSGKFLYVANGKSNTISIINTEEEVLTDTIPLPIETQFPGDIKVTPDNKYLIVTSETTNIISIIDLTLKQVVVKLDVGATTHGAYIVARESEIKKPDAK